MLKKRKAAALIMAVVVMMVFTILGTALLIVSSSEANIVSLQSKNMQAYYFARAGAESTFTAWKNAPSAGKSRPLGDSPTYYLQSDGSFSTTSTSLGKFQVKVTKSGDITTIISTGTYSNTDIKQTSTVTITQINNYLFGDTVGWYDYNSGQVNPGNHEHKKGSIVVKPKDHIKYPNKNDYTTTYDADTIYFDCSLGGPDHNKITLLTNVVVTYNSLEIFGNGAAAANSDLFLKVPTGGGITIGNGSTYLDGNGNTINVSGKKYGILYRWVSSTITERYYYPDEADGISLKTEISELIKMHPSDPNYEIPDYKNSFTYIWS